MPKKGTKTLRQRREVDRIRQKRFRQKLIEKGGRTTQIYFSAEAITKLDELKDSTGLGISQLVNKMVVEPDTENLNLVDQIGSLLTKLSDVKVDRLKTSEIEAIKLLGIRLAGLRLQIEQQGR